MKNESSLKSTITVSLTNYLDAGAIVAGASGLTLWKEYLQLTEGDHLGGVLGCVLVCELFCIDFISVHGLLPPSFDGLIIPGWEAQLNNTNGGLC